MQEELNQFKRNNICILVERPNKNSLTRTKWVYRYKVDENDIEIRNKAKLMA